MWKSCNEGIPERRPHGMKACRGCGVKAPHILDLSNRGDKMEFTLQLLCAQYNLMHSFKNSTGWTPGVRFPARQRDFSLLFSVQTGSGAHPASYSMGTGGSFPGGNVAVASHLHLVPRS
jgi:hypothetical protein